MPLEPLPETAAALEEVGSWSEEDLLADLKRCGEKVQQVVPECVGMSLAMFTEGLTFTLVATSEDIAALDAVQYAVGGPCVDAVLEEEILDTSGGAGLLDEGRWAAFARAGAAAGVLSTLSMPLGEKDRVIGGVNFYASTPDAFNGRHEALAAIMGAWAPGAVMNAEMTFSSRVAAREAPRLLADQGVIDRATGYVAAARRIDLVAAREVLLEAAARAGVHEADVARAVLKGIE
ncbi:ANTAR domain-containing protein [Pedococcus sp. 5OH_020]|uniref:ANTAR domain-containing protein n=1 Tax=Pedococcus sp. 5OH_020 TaxID=2989814 RepID=UPI0022E9CF66|nr:ANTAR domain-containing protein [Pedococcus sp. 5OH_020]